MLTSPSFLDTSWQVPVILVGNKIDLRGGEVTNEALEDEIVPIMNEFKVRASHTRLAHPFSSRNCGIALSESA